MSSYSAAYIHLPHNDFILKRNGAVVKVDIQLILTPKNEWIGDQGSRYSIPLHTIVCLHAHAPAPPVLALALANSTPFTALSASASATGVILLAAR